MTASLRRTTVLLILLFGVGAASAADISRALMEKPDGVRGLRDDLARKVAQSPDHAESWRDLGVCEIRNGDAVAALRALDRASEIDPADDKWRAAYRALALEGVGRAEEAAESWEAVAPSFTRHAERLQARAKAIRLWDEVRPAASDDAARVALLAPEALGDDPQRLGEVLASSLTSGLALAGLHVHDAAATTDLLARRGRRADELHDEEGRGRVGRALSQSNVRALVTSSYLVMEDGTFLVSVAVLPVTAEGVDATLPYQATAQVARALEVVPQLVSAIAADLGVQGVEVGELAAQMPATPASARALMAADAALNEGDLAAAIDGWTRAAQADPGATALAARVQGLSVLDGYTDDPVVVKLSDASPVIEVLVDEAGREHRRKRKFSDL